MKICLSELAISQINGLNGTGLELLARETSVYIKLGIPGDLFPLTMERCLFMSGSDNSVVTFMWNLGVRAPEVMSSLTIILPNSAISTLIGHGGCTIKFLQEQSGARMSVEDRVDTVKERILRISSIIPEIVYKCLRLVLDKISTDSQVGQNNNVSYNTHIPSVATGTVFATGVSMGITSRKRLIPMSSQKKLRLITHASG